MTPMKSISASRRSVIIGIDLGTTNAAWSPYRDLTAPKVIPGEDGRPSCPGVVSLTAPEKS